MNRRLVSAMRIGALALALSLVVESVQAQCTPPTQRARLIVSDTSPTGRDTLWFGFDASATPGIDPGLCELEYPPFPPQGVFHARFINPPGREGMEPPAGMGQGSPVDYRQYINAARIDTHRVKFQPNEPPGFPMNFDWSISQVTGICDSAWLQDEFGGILVKARMHVVSTLQVTNSAFTQLLLIRFGARLTDVEMISHELPTAFELGQNYPNPFNPTTTMRFAVQQQAATEIAVYDILGRKVSTLVHTSLAPGLYSATWNGVDDAGAPASSGIYFVRMTAQPEGGQPFSAMQKIMLLK